MSLAWLFGEPGASRTFLDAQVPYSMRALDEYVGVDAEQHVSPLEADRMAAAALKRGRHLAGDRRATGRRGVLHGHHSYGPPKEGRTPVRHRIGGVKTRAPCIP